MDHFYITFLCPFFFWGLESPVPKRATSTVFITSPFEFHGKNSHTGLEWPEGGLFLYTFLIIGFLPSSFLCQRSAQFWNISFSLSQFSVPSLLFSMSQCSVPPMLRAEANLPSPQIWSLNNKPLSMLSRVCDAVAIGLWGSEPLYWGRRECVRNRWAVRSAEQKEVWLKRNYKRDVTHFLSFYILFFSCALSLLSGCRALGCDHAVCLLQLLCRQNESVYVLDLGLMELYGWVSWFSCPH